MAKNNAELGMMAQSIVCGFYDLEPSVWAKLQFESAENTNYEEYLARLLINAFNDLGLKPKKCVTLTYIDEENKILNPHNFILENGKTLSVRTNYNGCKVCPRVVGQCGIDRFNQFFSKITNTTIKNKEEIKAVIYNNIDKMLPIYLDYFYISDYTIFISKDSDDYSYKIINKDSIKDISFAKKDLSFTKELKDWNESITLKYHDISIAEIQIHKNRGGYKFRFNLKNLIPLTEKQFNTEILGISAERAIAEKFNLDYPENLNKRSSSEIMKDLQDTIDSAFGKLPKATRYTGADRGVRGGNSKCSYDFVLEGNKTLSLKTNKEKMVCPPEVGQPSSKTCEYYFGKYLDGMKMSRESFKIMTLKHVKEMVDIYISHLFDSDFLLWIRQDKNAYKYEIFKSDFAKAFNFDPSKFSFTKKTPEERNESNTLKYDGVTIGEFQVHKNRDSFKFRFNLKNLSKIINSNKKKTKKS